MQTLTNSNIGIKEIPLTQGKIAVVDDDDYEWLSQWKWCVTKVNKGKSDLYYAIRATKKEDGKQTTILMHRAILGLSFGESGVDHIDGNSLNNTKANLRLSTQSQNIANGRKRSGSSQYKGVNWQKIPQKWRAGIRLQYKSYHLGLFANEIEAAYAYDVKAKEFFGEYANLNFPERRER